MALSKKIVKIPTLKENVYLDAWYYTPPGSGPFAVVIAAPGMTVVKDAGMAFFAERWANDAGFASVVFDYRGFGASDGHPRNVVDLKEQLKDFRSCIEWVRARPEEFLINKIALMGCAMGGFCVAELLLNDPTLAGGMAHCPLLDGYAMVMNGTPNPRLLFWAIVDYIGSKLGLRPVYIRAVGRPGEFAFINSPDSYPGFVDMYHQGNIQFEDMPNVVAPRLAFQILSARPGRSFKNSQSPMLVVMAENDDLIPSSITRQIATESGDRMTLVIAPGGHYDVMPGGKGYNTNIIAQIKFLKELL